MLGWLTHGRGCEITTSQLFNEQTFYSQFHRDLARAKQEIVIESPFMTTRRVDSLILSLKRAIQRKVSITVNTREPNEHDEYFYNEALQVVSALQNIGINVLFTTGHHRKLAVIDRQILWEGSHNILSQNTSCEIMRRIESEALAQQTLKFIGLKKLL